MKKYWAYDSEPNEESGNFYLCSEADEVIAKKDATALRLAGLLQTGRVLVSDYAHTLAARDKTIGDLQRTNCGVDDDTLAMLIRERLKIERDLVMDHLREQALEVRQEVDFTKSFLSIHGACLLRGLLDALASEGEKG